MTRVGDALQEPFWPEGLGINRGFLHALDCADLVGGFAAVRAREAAAALAARGGGGADGAAAEARRGAAQLLERREQIFGCVKRVSGSNRLTELKKPADKQQHLTYRIDPASRYVNLPADLKPLPA